MIDRVPEVQPQKIARQPFTFAGVARFAHARFVRLLLGAIVFGLISGVVVSWLTASCIAPMIDEAVANLPTTGSIKRGTLIWPEKNGRLLGANPFISLSVATDKIDSASAPVDFAFEFRRDQLVIDSLLGKRWVPYPPRFELELNRTALFPVWGAWRGPILLALIPGTALALMLSWGTLALLYAIIPLLIGSIFGRDLGFARAWKLSIAAQLPGSLMMAFALALYSTGKISLVLVLVMLPAHVVPTLIYLVISPCFLPKKPNAGDEENPFVPEKKKAKGKNPFASK